MPLPPHRVAGYLAQRVRFGIKFGLDTMRALVAEMGHPERAYPTLLIAGTNGKGSVAAYCDAALRASGLRTGRSTSPHLVRVRPDSTVDTLWTSPAENAFDLAPSADAAGNRLQLVSLLQRTPRVCFRQPAPRGRELYAGRRLDAVCLREAQPARPATTVRATGWRGGPP